jgi:Fe-S cluster assembly protein SufD
LPSNDPVQVQRIEFMLEADATANIYALNTAATYGRIEIDVTLADGARFGLDAANIGAGKSTLEIVTTVRHIGVGATSRQTVRSVLGGTAVGTYMGKVAVARSGQQTDSVQSVKAMLLDRGATANAKPELEIYADDVKCAHGATVGELDPEQLFYAAARGLDPASARALLLEGFVAGLWSEIEGDDQGIAELARAALWRVA